MQSKDDISEEKEDCERGKLSLQAIQKYIAVNYDAKKFPLLSRTNVVQTKGTSASGSFKFGSFSS